MIYINLINLSKQDQVSCKQIIYLQNLFFIHFLGFGSVALATLPKTKKGVLNVS